jgi:hypothetical protein
MNNNIKVSIDNGKLYLQICDIDFILDQEQTIYIMNNTTKKWLIDDKYSRYPYFNENNKKINLLHFLYDNKHLYEFKNDNIYDLRTDNVIILDIKNEYHEIICNNYNIIDYNIGHYRQDKYFNSYWKCINNNIIMLCSENIIFELTEEQFNKILEYEKTIDFKLTWTYLFHKNLRNIYTRYKTNKINIKTIIDDFDIDNIKSIENNNIINLTNDKAKTTFLTTHNIEECKKIEKKNKIKMDEMDKIVKNTYNLLKTYKGHIRNIGRDAFMEKNRMWKIFDEEENKNIYLMYCEPNDFIILCKKSIKIIKEFEQNNTGKITWHRHTNGYVQGSNNMYIHQIITGCYGNGRGTMDISVDHIDRNKLNNCFDNLKIATREEQEANTKTADGKRRERSRSAKPLPEGITNDMMKKYVVYYHEKYGNNSFREFFKIEKNPKLDKPWIGSKSNKISILEKLNAANAMVDLLTTSE